MGIYTRFVTDKLLTAMRGALAADEDLLAFFGAEGIQSVEYEQLEGAIRPPYLALVSGAQKGVRQASGFVELDCVTRARVYLPRATPTNEGLTIPAAPALSVTASGSLTGTYLYRRTSWDASGESFASDFATLTASGTSITITGAGTGERLWRTKAGRIAFHYLATLQPGVSSFVDNLPDSALGDEMAPIAFMGQNLKDYLRKVLYQNETFADPLDVRQADASLVFEDEKDEIDVGRNLRVITMKVVTHTVIRTETMQPAVEEVG